MKKWECTVCGYIHEGEEPPEECPVCSADKSMFVELTEAAPAAEPLAEPASSVVTQESWLIKIERLATSLILQYHLHPITVHTPNGIIPMAVIFLILGAWLGSVAFETAAFFSLIFVLLTMPAVIYTGYTVWQMRYRGAMTSVFKIKIGASAVTLVSLTILVLWRVADPAILTTSSTGRWLYILLALIVLGAVGLAGHMGGKLVFGSRNQ